MTGDRKGSVTSVRPLRWPIDVKEPLRVEEAVELAQIVGAIVVFGTALGTKFLVDRRRATRRADAPDGIEVDRAGRVSYRTLPFALVLIAGQGLWLMVRGDMLGGLVSYGVLALVVAAYWINDVILRGDDG
jgi:uncharacterized membrane protein